MSRFFFPKWANKVLPVGVVFGLGPLGTAVVAGFWYYGTDKHFSVGYAPEQPIQFSHKLHAGDMGMDCRYCHNTVERAAFAAVPPTQTCMNCHATVRASSPKLAPLRESWEKGTPVQWVKVHNLPDFVFFDHSAHLNAGVGCESCHGRIDQMRTVTQREPLTMGWCLECHRDPSQHLRDPKDITKMGLLEQSREEGKPMPRPADARKPSPPLHCSGCHR
ncbi:MAG: cytochrome c3 family protein [Polyangiaceae bacterium]